MTIKERSYSQRSRSLKLTTEEHAEWARGHLKASTSKVDEQKKIRLREALTIVMLGSGQVSSLCSHGPWWHWSSMVQSWTPLHHPHPCFMSIERHRPQFEAISWHLNTRT